MLKRTLAIYMMALCSMIGLQAIEPELPSSSNPIEVINESEIQEKTFACHEGEEDQIPEEILACKKEQPVCEKGKYKDLTPGALVCNGSEEECTKEGEKKESSSSHRFSVFCDDNHDEKNLLACKNCQ
jgi:hypothetical protein